MLKKLQLLFFVSIVTINIAKAQVGQGALKGKIIDKETNEPVPFANVAVFLNGNQISGATTDFDGVYFVKPLPPGKYEVKATYVGYQPAGISGVVVKADQTSYQDIKISQGVQLSEFEYVEYEVPLINKNGGSDQTVTREEIARMPGRSAESVAITVGGVYSADGERGSVRGTRSDATDTYIDGVKVRGSANLPQSAIEQVSVLLGGVPAQYGDITGGVISITTRGAASSYFGGLEVVSSQFTDKFGYNLLGFNVSGPLIQKTNPIDSSKTPLLGFFLSGELKSEVDPRPSAIGTYKVKDDVLADIQANPLRLSGTTGGTYQNAEFLTAKDFEKIATRQNAQSKGATIQGKIDVNTSKSTNLTFGGTYDYSNRRSFDLDNALFNSYNNGLALLNTWRVYARFTQRFGNEASNSSESASTIKNAYYSIQVDYSKEKNKFEDAKHKDALFDYGYVGKYTSKFIPNLGPGTATVNVNGQNYTYTGNIQNNFEQISYDFQPGTQNPILSNYTQNYYDLNTGYYDIKNSEQVKQGGGLLNGYLPRNTNTGGVYNLWTVAGAPYNYYGIEDNGMFRIRTTGSADIKSHALLVGFEYEQRDDRGYFVNKPVNLWQLGDKLVNNHLQQLDTSKATVIWEGSVPSVYYDRLNASPGDYKGGDAQSFFDYNVRKSLGLNPDGTDYVDFNSYAPSQFSMSYFSADDLLQNSYVSYFGYDHAGNRLKNKPSFADYFNAKDDYNNLTRSIGAFQPIYLAGYIQDKFDWEDLKFNLGLRVDRFDANQKVLKDQYSFFETKKVSDVGGSHPSNIGNDYVMYVSDINNPSVNNIVGYRNGSTWYNADGVQISNPVVLETSTGIAPWLIDPKATTAQTQLKETAFTDYVPQINLMPRVAFSFPISDEALFFAHYDVLTQRPNTGGRLDITDYMYIKSRGGVINNPNLKPQKTIDYELGFQQALNRSSSLKISAFYKELRDMIQVVPINYAFPQSYVTYGNMDFGTVKGLTLSYDLRQTGNVSLRASYTLQFADGTGSSASSGYNLATTAVGNIRTALPLSFDRRHAFTASLDYRYGEGKDYNGPVWFNKQVFANTGVNIQGNGGSGAPYSANYNVTPTAFGTNDINTGDGQLKGSLNGSRLPFAFRINLRVDKDINLKWGGSEGVEAKKTSLNVYALVTNVLNAQNILNVYKATGTANDDGYLNAPQFQNQIYSQVSPQSFIDLYSMKMASPGFYSLPRTIRLGIIMNF